MYGTNIHNVHDITEILLKVALNTIDQTIDHYTTETVTHG